MSLIRLALAASLVAGCSDSTPPGQGGGVPDAEASVQTCAPGPDGGDLPCDVSAVLQARCQHCHTTPKLPPPDNAPFTLRTYEDLAAPFGTTGLRRWQRVAQVIEPGNFPHMPPATQPQPTPSDLATLRGWFAACAPPLQEGTGCDVAEDGGTGGDASDDEASESAAD